MTSVSIIVPVYNALDEARDCIKSIYSARTFVDFEVIVVDNGSHRDVTDWLSLEQKERHNFPFIHFDEPLGFARAINEGVQHARFPFLVLLNSDTVVGDGWLDKLANALEEDRSLGIVSPVTNRCGHELQRDPAAQWLSAEDTQRYAESIRDRRGILDEPQRLVFFCVMLRRTLWDQIGGLDEAFRTGNFEDDDFCLRTRIAGYRMAVIQDAFVFHYERRTFESNRLNHGEWLARNQALFGEHASHWSTNLRPAPTESRRLDSLSVIVPVLPHRAEGLCNSLASLANQTVQGFETVVVSPVNYDISSQLQEFAGRLRVTAIQVEVEENEGPAPLLNAGSSRAAGTEIAYLPASDIFYPFHLEVLWESLLGGKTEAVYSAWNVVVKGPTGERRSSVAFPEAEPNIELGDWVPLLCWMHGATASSGLSFDSVSGAFAPWRFLIRLRERVGARYLCRVTCERRPDKPSVRDATDVEDIMQLFPVNNVWKETQRRQFIDAVRLGSWEDRLVVSRNDRVRRVRSVFGGKSLSLLRHRFDEHASAIGVISRDATRPDIILFSTIEWAALTQRPHHFAAGLAALGHRVFWIDVHLRAPEVINPSNLVRQLEPGIFHVSLPAFEDSVYNVEWRPEVLDTMVAAFGYLRAAYGISTAVQLVNFPRWQPLCSALASRFHWHIVYDCLDDQQAFADLYGHDLGQYETALIETSSAVVVSGRVLLNEMRERRPDTILIPNAADFDLFHSARGVGLLDGLVRPVAGFFGAFADWLDFDWIDAAAKRFPTWSFVYIGRDSFAKTSPRRRWEHVTSHSNVHVFPQATPRKLVQYLAEFEVCTMPFQDLPVTRSMNAVKLFEYLAAGKPVIAADLPETRPMREAGLIATYRSIEESFGLLEEAVAEGSDEEAVKARVAFARRNTWKHRVEALSDVLTRVSQTASARNV